MKGFVKWFNNEKGFGFIEYKEGEDVFVHYSQVRQDGYKSLNEGDYVSFELIETEKGLQALDVYQIKKTVATKQVAFLIAFCRILPNKGIVWQNKVFFVNLLIILILYTYTIEVNCGAVKFIIIVKEVDFLNGLVKWFNNEKGFGFIEYKEGEDVFVHYSQIRKDGYKTLNDGDFVSFNLIETEKGLQASDVYVIKQAVATKQQWLFLTKNGILKSQEGYI